MSRLAETFRELKLTISPPGDLDGFWLELARLCQLAAAVLLFWLGYTTYRIVSSHDWVPQTAQLVAEPGLSLRHRVIHSYRYSVDGLVFEGHRFYFGGNSFLAPRLAAEFTLYRHPEHPGSAVVFRRWSALHWVAFGAIPGLYWARRLIFLNYASPGTRYIPGKEKVS